MELEEKLKRYFNLQFGTHLPENLSCYDSMLRIIDENKEQIAAAHRGDARYVLLFIPPSSILTKRGIWYTEECQAAARDICKLNPIVFDHVQPNCSHPDCFEIRFRREEFK